MRNLTLWVLPLAQSYSYPFRYVTIHNAVCSLGKIPPEAVCATLLRRLPRRPCKAEQIPVRVRTMFAPSTSNILPSATPYQAGHTQGTLLGANRLTLDEKHGIINSPINKNLQERINIAPLVDLKERENSDELYKKWKISNA